MDQSVSSIESSTNGSITNRVLNGQLQFVYSGSAIQNFDVYWNNFLKMKLDTSFMSALSNMMGGYTSSSSLYYFSPCLSYASQLIMILGPDTSYSESLLRGLIIATCVLGISLLSCLIYMGCFGKVCKGLTWRRKLSENKSKDKDIVQCETFSTEGSTHAHRSVLGATSKPKYSTDVENMSQYDMDSNSIMSPSSQTSDSSSAKKTLGIMSIHSLLQLMRSPTNHLVRAQQDLYNMSMSDGNKEDDDDCLHKENDVDFVRENDENRY
jgi:hypothetical protein